MTTVIDDWFLQFQTLPPPQMVESTAGMEDTILTARVSDLQTLLPEWIVNISEPVYGNMEVSAYRETILRQYFNLRAQQQFIRYAEGANLDNIALAFGVVRRQGEGDDSLRLRIPSAFAEDCLITPAGIRAIARQADARVFDVQPIRRANRVDIDVYVLTYDGNPDADVNNAVSDAIESDMRRPVHLDFYVHPAGVLSWRIDIALTHDARYSDAGIIEEQARLALYRLIDNTYRLGSPITQNQVKAAATVPGVLNATLSAPLEHNALNNFYDLTPLNNQVYVCAKSTPSAYDNSTPPVPLDGVRITVTAVTVPV